jgi:predicted Zn-dependent protease
LIAPQELVERALAHAAAGGADGSIVIVRERSHADVRYALNTTTTNGLHRTQTVSVIALSSAPSTPSAVGVGTARRSGIRSTSELEELVDAALADARGAPPATDAAPLVPPSEASTARAFDRPPEVTDATVLEPVVSSLAGAFERARRRGTILAGFAEHDVVTTYLGTSTGLRASHAQPTGSTHLVARAPDGAGSAWVGVPTVDPELEAMEADVVRRLAWADRSRELEAGRYPVILPPSAVADLMAVLAFYGLGGQNAEDGRNVFSKEGGGTRVGEPVSARHFTLWSDPAEEGIECVPFVTAEASGADTSVFDNGLGVGRVDWIHDGVLSHLRYHRAGAARSGVPTSPYVDNLALTAAPASGTVDDLVARTEQGLLLTCLWYIREVDPSTLLVTGLTRDGVYVIEDGAVVAASNNFRFNESPVDLLSRAIEVGQPERTLGREFGESLNRCIMPALRIPDFNMSSVSSSS